MTFDLEIKNCMPAGVDLEKLHNPYNDPALPIMVERYFEQNPEIAHAVQESIFGIYDEHWDCDESPLTKALQGSLAFDNNDTILPPQIAAMQSKALRENP